MAGAHTHTHLLHLWFNLFLIWVRFVTVSPYTHPHTHTHTAKFIDQCARDWFRSIDAFLSGYCGVLCLHSVKVLYSYNPTSFGIVYASCLATTISVLNIDGVPHSPIPKVIQSVRHYRLRFCVWTIMTSTETWTMGFSYIIYYFK